MNRYAITIAGGCVAGALILAGCGDNSPSDKEKLEKWAPTIEADFQNLENALKVGQVAARDLDYSGMMAACTDALTSVNNLQEKDPMPIESETWTSMLNSSEKGLTACAAGDFSKAVAPLLDSQAKLTKLGKVLDDIPLN